MFDHHEKFGNQEIGKSYHLQVQKNFPSSHPGQVDFLAGQVTFQASSPNHPGNCHPQTKSFTKGTFQKSELAGQTSHFDKEVSFSQEFLLKNYLLHACCLGID